MIIQYACEEYNVDIYTLRAINRKFRSIIDEYLCSKTVEIKHDICKYTRKIYMPKIIWRLFICPVPFIAPGVEMVSWEYAGGVVIQRKNGIPFISKKNQDYLLENITDPYYDLNVCKSHLLYTIRRVNYPRLAYPNKVTLTTTIKLDKETVLYELGRISDILRSYVEFPYNRGFHTVTVSHTLKHRKLWTVIHCQVIQKFLNNQVIFSQVIQEFINIFNKFPLDIIDSRYFTFFCKMPAFKQGYKKCKAMDIQFPYIIQKNRRSYVKSYLTYIFKELDRCSGEGGLLTAGSVNKPLFLAYYAQISALKEKSHILFCSQLTSAWNELIRKHLNNYIHRGIVKPPEDLIPDTTFPAIIAVRLYITFANPNVTSFLDKIYTLSCSDTVTEYKRDLLYFIEKKWPRF